LIVVDYHLKPLSEIDTAGCIRHRVREPQQTLNQSIRKGKSATEKRSWFSSAVDNVHRFLIGSRK